LCGQRERKVDYKAVGQTSGRSKDTLLSHLWELAQFLKDTGSRDAVMDRGVQEAWRRGNVSDERGFA